MTRGRLWAASLFVAVACAPTATETTLLVDVSFDGTMDVHQLIFQEFDQNQVAIYGPLARPVDPSPERLPSPQSVRIHLPDSRADQYVYVVASAQEPGPVGRVLGGYDLSIAPRNLETTMAIRLRPVAPPDAGQGGGAGGGSGGGTPGGGPGGGGGGPGCQCGTACCAQGGPTCAQPEVLQVKSGSLPDGGEGVLAIPCGASATACSTRCGLFESNECKGGQCFCGGSAACGPGLRCTAAGNCACDRLSNCDGCCAKDGTGRPVCVSRLDQASQKLCGFAGSICTGVAAATACGCAQLGAGQCCGGTSPVDAGFPVCPSVFKRCVACDRLRSNACGPGASSAVPDDVCVCGSTGKACAASEYCEARGGGRCVPLPSL